jgi:hypothetical protein
VAATFGGLNVKTPSRVLGNAEIGEHACNRVVVAFVAWHFGHLHDF